MHPSKICCKSTFLGENLQNPIGSCKKETLLRKRWEEEKQLFHETPRHPNWKEEKYSEAQKQQKGAINMLLDHVGIQGLAHERVTVALWKKIQSLVIAVEGELVTKDGQLMGRLDLLLANVDDEGNLTGWLVADLKTGKPPQGKLKPEVNRQLRMYRDILLSNNEKAPPVQAQGWYTDTSSKWDAVGENVLEAAYEAWNATQPSDTPLDPTPDNPPVEVFAIGKHGVLIGGHGGMKTSPCTEATSLMALFSSISTTRAARRQLLKNVCREMNRARLNLREKCEQSDLMVGKESLEALLDAGHQGPLFLGSAMMNRDVWRVGPWCDVLPWAPIPDSGRP